MFGKYRKPKLRLLAQITLTLLCVFLVLTFLFFCTQFAQTRGQLFVVEARTLGAEITVTKDTTWNFYEYTHCERREKRNITAQKPPNSVCDPVLYKSPMGVSGDELTFQIKAGSKVELKTLYSGLLQIRFTKSPGPISSSAGRDFGINDRLLVPKESWLKAGGQGAEGGLTVGEPAGTGSSGYLLSGRYAVWENLPSRLITKSGPVEVKSGLLRSGDVVSFERDAAEQPEQVLMFFSPAQDALGGFHVRATSRPDAANLFVTLFGANKSKIETIWLDRLFLDAYTTGFLTLVLSLFAFTRVVHELFSFFDEPSTPVDELVADRSVVATDGTDIAIESHATGNKLVPSSGDSENPHDENEIHDLELSSPKPQ